MKKNKHGVNRKTALSTAVIAGLLLSLSGCATTDGQKTSVEKTMAAQTIEKQTITANVFYLQRIGLPPGAQVTLILEDISKVDMPAVVIAEQTITAASPPPYQLDVSYDAAKIKPQHRYALRANITLDGQLLFTNTEQVDAFANQGLAPSEIVVSQVRAGSEQTNLNNIQWHLSMLGAQAVTTEVTQYTPYLMFKQDDNQVVGFAGCNRFSGNYAALGDSVQLTELLTTKKLCFQQMNLETQFLTALSEVESYKVIDNTLTLYSNGGIALGQFTAEEK